MEYALIKISNVGVFLKYAFIKLPFFSNKMIWLIEINITVRFVIKFCIEIMCDISLLYSANKGIRS